MTSQEKEQKLKLALAKMLPEHIKVFKPVTQQPCWFEWNDDKPFGRQIKDTEWLHICWLIERGMTDELERVEYLDELHKIYLTSKELSNEFNDYRLWWVLVNLSWQQRAETICKVKGVEI